MNRNEVWRPIAGYEGYYEISSCGRVKSLGRYIQHEAKSTRTIASRWQSERLLKPQTDGLRILPREAVQRGNEEAV